MSLKTVENYRLKDWHKLDAMKTDGDGLEFLANDWTYKNPWVITWGDMLQSVYDTNGNWVVDTVEGIDWWNF